MSEPTDPQLRDRLVAALGEVRLNLGPNALAMIGRGETIRLSGNEKDAVADVALGIIQHDLESLEQQAANARAVARDANRRPETAQAERDRALASVPLVCSDDRHQAKVRGLEELLAEARAEVDQVNTELAAYELHAGPPRRAVTSTADISDYEEAQP